MEAIYAMYIAPMLASLRVHWFLTLIGFLTLYAFVSFLRSRDALRRIGLPGPPFYPIVGSYLGILRDRGHMYKTFGRYVKRYGDVFAMNFQSEPVIFVANPDMLRAILVKDFQIFYDRPGFGLVFPKPLDSMMAVLKGEHWKRIRKILSPSFTSGKLKNVTGTMRRTSNTFLEELSKVADTDKSVDIYGLLQNATLDVILSTAFGVESACQTNPDDVVARYAKDTISPRAYFPFIKHIPFIGNELSKKLIPTNYGFRYGNIQKIAEKIIAQRKAHNNKEYSDMLAMAINAQDPENKGTQLTDEEVLAQSVIFLIASFDASSNALGLLCYHLALDQHIQKRVYDEIVAVMGDGPVEYEKLSQMVYMEAVISEVLRLYPTGFMISRCANEDCDVAGIHFKKNMPVLIPIYSIHRDERYWEDPDSFNPERFMPENADRIKPYTYMPFGLGPRNCIGARFAQFEVKYVLISLLRKYRVVKGEHLHVPIKLIVSSRPFAVRNILTLGSPVDVKLVSRMR